MELTDKIKKMFIESSDSFAADHPMRDYLVAAIGDIAPVEEAGPGVFLTPGKREEIGSDIPSAPVKSNHEKLLDGIDNKLIPKIGDKFDIGITNNGKELDFTVKSKNGAKGASFWLPVKYVFDEKWEVRPSFINAVNPLDFAIDAKFKMKKSGWATPGVPRKLLQDLEKTGTLTKVQRDALTTAYQIANSLQF